MKVEAWDKDPFFSDVVGAAVTDEHGTFVIEFDASYFQEWFLDKRPDLFFKVSYKGKLLKTTTPVMRNVPAGDTPVVIELDDHIDAPTADGGPPRVMDFCEAAITPEAIEEATNEKGGPLQLQREAALSIANAITEWLRPLQPSSQKPVPVDLTAVYEAVKTAVDPATTIPARVSSRLKLLPGVHQQGDLGLLESEVEFPQPMFQSLAAIAQDLILPGIETVPVNVISLLKSNTRFLESFLLGLNTAWGSEAIWSGAQVFPSTTFFRQFWNVDGCADPDADPELSKDIERITRWKRFSALGSHAVRQGETAEKAVLLIRSDLLKRFPDTLVYAVESDSFGNPVFDERVWPMFSGTLAPDLIFLGFDKTVAELADGGDHDRGFFIVLEERLSQPRFGFDVPQGDESVVTPLPTHDHWWYDLTWAHVEGTSRGEYIDDNTIPNPASRSPRWGESSATMANICLQRPVRVSIHARRMLSNLASFGCENDDGQGH